MFCQDTFRGSSKKDGKAIKKHVKKIKARIKEAFKSGLASKISSTKIKKDIQAKCNLNKPKLNKKLAEFLKRLENRK